MKRIYAPGCALMIYNPTLSARLKEWAEAKYGEMSDLMTCCFSRPEVEEGAVLYSPCTTCCEHYKKDNPQLEVRWLLQDILESEDFPFPDYGGQEMSIQDTCSGRTQTQYLEGVRALLQRMNIRIVEAEKSGRRGKCCGQTFYGKLPLERVEAFMRQRAEEMPREDVVVYCASCIQSMMRGGRRPRFLLDLLFGMETAIQEANIDGWNRQLVKFRNEH